jgi:hypothetical protein
MASLRERRQLLADVAERLADQSGQLWSSLGL